MGVLEQSQIHSTFISLIIDGTQYGTVGTNSDAWSPQIITSLEVSKASSGENFTADGYVFTIELNYQLIPDFYERMLKLIKANSDGMIPATLQYGYYSDYDSWGECSPLYELKMLSCQPTDLWSRLQLKFIQVENKNSYNVFTEKTSTALNENEYNNLSDYVQTIAEGQGWAIGHIEPTIPYDGKIERDESIATPIQCITELLTRYPNESTKGEGGYICAFKNVLGKSLFYFIPTTFLAEGSNYGYVESDSTYEFFFNALPQGKVITFTPKFVSGLVESSQGDTINPDNLRFEERPDLAVITTDTREIQSIQYNMESASPNSNSITPQNSYAGYINPANVQRNIDSRNLLNYMRSSIKEKISNYVNVVGVRTSAEMEILGDPSLSVGDYILVIPMYPQTNYENPGKIHPSGGTYRINKIVDHIANGTFTTNLTLMAVDNPDFKVGELTKSTMPLYNVTSIQEEEEEINEGDALSAKGRSVSARYWLGDSRFEMMEQYATSKDTFIAKSGAGLSWLRGSAASTLANCMSDPKNSAIILGFGVNDIYQPDAYIGYYRSFIDSYKDSKVVITSINPVYDPKSTAQKYPVSNSEIDNFNAKVKANFPANYLDTNSQIRDLVTASTTDSEGVHYSDSINQKVFDIIANYVG